MTDCIDHGQNSKTGYGYTSRNGKSCLMHRAVFAEANGIYVHNLGGVVMHSCDNPRCVNLDHLSYGSCADNSADMAAKGRSPHGPAHHMTTLTTEQVEYIRENYKFRHPEFSGKQLAAKFGVGRMVVSDIVRGVSRVKA